MFLRFKITVNQNHIRNNVRYKMIKFEFTSVYQTHWAKQSYENSKFLKNFIRKVENVMQNTPAMWKDPLLSSEISSFL